MSDRPPNYDLDPFQRVIRDATTSARTPRATELPEAPAFAPRDGGGRDQNGHFAALRDEAMRTLDGEALESRLAEISSAAAEARTGVRAGSSYRANPGVDGAFAGLPAPNGRVPVLGEGGGGRARAERRDERGALPSDPQMRSTFEEIAAEENVPVNVLMALAQQESGYNPRAFNNSSRTAGMMQYAPDTARSVGLNPYDWRASIRQAAQDYRRQIDAGLSPVDAVRHHFAGPDRRGWGSRTNQYGLDVMRRARDIRQAYLDEAPTPTLPPEPPAPIDEAAEPTATRGGRRVMEETFGPRTIPGRTPPELPPPPAPDETQRLAEEPVPLAPQTPLELRRTRVERGVQALGRVPDRSDLVREQAAQPLAMDSPQSFGGQVPGYAEQNPGERAGEQLRSGQETVRQGRAASNIAGLVGALAQADQAAQGRPIPPDAVIPWGDLSPEQRVTQRARIEESLGRQVKAALESRGRQAELARNPNMEPLAKAADEGRWGDVWSILSSDPAGILQQLGVESLPASAMPLLAGAAGAALAGRIGAAMGQFGGSATADFGPRLAEMLSKRMQEGGVDLTSEEAVNSWLRANPQMVREMAGAAGRGAVMPGLADAVSQGLARPLRRGDGALRTAGNVARNLAVEIGSEGAGEAAAQVASTGQVQPSEVLFEMLGAGPQAAGTTAIATAMGREGEATRARGTTPQAEAAPNPSEPGAGPAQPATSPAPLPGEPGAPPPTGPVGRAVAQAVQGGEVDRVIIGTELEGDVPGTMESYQEGPNGTWRATVLGDDGQIRRYTDRDGVSIRRVGEPAAAAETPAQDEERNQPPGQEEPLSPPDSAQEGNQPPAAAAPRRAAVQRMLDRLRDPGQADDLAVIPPNVPTEGLNLEGLLTVETPRGLVVTNNPDKAQAVREMVARTFGTPAPEEAPNATARAVRVGDELLAGPEPRAEDRGAVAPGVRGGEDRAGARRRRAAASPRVNGEAVPVAAPPREPPAGVGAANAPQDPEPPPVAPRRESPPQAAPEVSPRSTEAPEAVAPPAAPTRAHGEDLQAAALTAMQTAYPRLVDDQDARRSFAGGFFEGVQGQPTIPRGRGRAEKLYDAGLEAGRAFGQPAPAAPRSEAPATPPAPVPKWFGTQERAEEHIARSGLAGSHEVRAIGRRFEIHPRQDAIAQAAAEAATSPANELPAPTEAQKEAGNYRKGHVAIGGLDVSIENPAGTRRRPEWPPLAHTYGYVRGSKGADGDHVDVFLGPNADDPTNPVWIVDQTDGKGGLDEHKVMVGFPSAQAAREGYLANYTPGWDRLGGLRKMSFDEFKAWVLDPEQTARPASSAMRRKAPEAGTSLQKAQGTPEAPPAAEPAAEPSFIVSEDAMNAARERIRAKLARLHSGIDPELLLDGVTLALGHIERGARSFAAFARATVGDLGEMVRPYLKSWYLGARFDPRASSLEGMDSAASVEAADLDALIGPAEAGEADARPAADEANTGAGDQGSPAEPARAADGDGRADADRGPAARRDARGRRGDEGRDANPPDDAEQPGPRARPEPARAEAVDGGPGERPDGAGAGDRGNRRAAGAEHGHNQRALADYRYAPGELNRDRSWKGVAERNVQAVELIKTLQAENRQATPEERAMLARFTGWGASEIANGIFPDRSGRYKDGWQPLGERLIAAMTPEEYAAARRSTQYAHYTSEQVIRSVYAGLQRLGFAGGRVLEPGMGIGLFKGLMPDGIASASSYMGIEFDPMTAAIARQLYPQSNIREGDYTRTEVPRDFFDAAIGNPPFGSIRITDDPEYRARRFLLHDYFFAKTVDRVRPGGLLVFVTSKGTMDKGNSTARRYLADRANLLGAVRLPQTAFKDNAGTEVVTDVIFLQKRGPGIAANDVPWLGTAEVQTPQGPTRINEYFAAHPEMVLGEHALSGSMYRADEYTVTPRAGDIEQHFADAVANLPEAVFRPARGSTAEAAQVLDRDFNPKVQKEGSIYVGDGGALYQRRQGAGAPLTARLGADGKEITLRPREVAFLRDYTGLRDALKQAQFDQLNDGDWEASLGALNTAYDAFVAEHGNILAHTVTERENDDGTTTVITRWKNNTLLNLDAENALIRALEKINPDGSIAKGQLLQGRTLKKPIAASIQGVRDALLVSLNDIGRLDMGEVARLAGVSQAEAIAEMGDAIYREPSGNWQMADAYLSGNVVRKLAEARTAARLDPAFKRNVDALQAVQPAPLAPQDITVQLGAHWVPAKDVEIFTREVLAHPALSIRHNDILKSWTVEGPPEAGSEWGVEKMDPTEILEAVLNSRTIRITERVSDGKGGTTTIPDPVMTEAANQIATKMQREFGRWIWTDADRAARLARYYNEHFNNIVPRQFNGDHLTLPGISSRFQLYPHQKRAIWRGIQDGNMYLAHAVGAGKTFTMIAAGMEERRLGLSRKPMYVVPRHMLAQFAREFQELYPTAHIMVADEEAFHTGARREFVARAALNDPDAIIITHPAFSRIGMSAEFNDAYVQRQIDGFKEILDEVDSDDRTTVKKLEATIERLERRLSGAVAQQKKDVVLTFEELGVDRLMVDEFHEFRKLDFSTNRGSVKGIDPTGSQRSMDMHMKVQWLEEQNPGRSLIAASGTPITNTMGELFTVQRFMQPKQLEEDGIDTFDAWAAQFGQAVEALEPTPAGNYEPVTRFANFVNVPDLMRRVRSFMDILTSEQLGDLVKRPAVQGGARKISVTPIPDGYKDYQKELDARIKAIRARTGPPKPGDDIILSVISDGRFSAIDMRFVDPSRPPDPNSKLNRFIDRLVSRYHATADWEYSTDGRKDAIPGASLMAFSDIGLGDQSAASRGFAMRDWITSSLIAQRVKPEHIAFIRDYKQSAKKERLFADMRAGKVRILIGGKDMETGVNAQKRLAYLAHLDAPWFPASVEQREGRGIRQGNQNSEIEIEAFATKGSYDSTMWSMNARKQRFISQAMQGDDSVRKMEDVSEASSFEMAAALASGDERYLKLAGLRADAERLGRLWSAHERNQRDLRSEREHQRALAEFSAGRVKALEASLARRQPLGSGEAFTATINDQDIATRDSVSEAIFAAMRALADEQRTGRVVIGSLGGFPIEFHGQMLKGSKDYQAYVELDLPDVQPLASWPADEDFSIKGIAQRATNQIGALDRDLRRFQTQEEDARAKAEQVGRRIGAPFPEATEYREKQEQLAELEAELAAETAAAEAQAEAAPAIQEQPPAEPERRYASAPRGNPARIPESRYGELVPIAQVRADEFGSPDGDHTARIARAKAWMGERLHGALVVNEDQGWSIRINGRGLRETWSRMGRPEKVASVVAVPDLIRNAVLAHSSPPHEGADKATKAVHTLYAPLRVGDDLYAVKLVVKERNNGTFFYDHEMSALVEEERNPAPGANAGPATEAGRNALEAGPAGPQPSMTIGNLIAIVKDQGRPRAWRFGVEPVGYIPVKTVGEAMDRVLMHRRNAEHYEQGADAATTEDLRTWAAARADKSHRLAVRYLQLADELRRASGRGLDGQPPVEQFGSAGAQPQAPAARPARSTRDALLAGPDGPMVSWLLNQGAIQLHAPGDAPRGAPRDVAGWADRDGVIHLMDDLSPSQARAFLLHETFHAGVKPLIGSRAWNGLLSELEPLYTRAVNQIGTPLNRFWQEAAERVVEAAEAGDPNLLQRPNMRILAEEFGAYAVSQVDRAPRALRLWVEKAIGAIKAWALVRFGRQLGEITPAQLHALARGALQAGAATQRAILANSLTDKTRYSTEQRGAALAEASAELASPPPATADFEGRVRRDMSLITRYLAHPRHIAALFRPFAPVYVAVMDRMGRRDRIISDLNEDYAPYAALPQEGKAKVNQVLELGRLLGEVYDSVETSRGVKNPGHRVAVRYEAEGTPRRYHKPLHAALTKPNEVVVLSHAEATAYFALRKMFDRTLDMTRDRMLDEMGFSEVIGNPDRLRELLAQARQDPSAGRKVIQVAKFVSDIEQSKRSGYVPFTRFGDYVVTVRRPRAIIQYATDPRMPSRYLAFGVPDNENMRDFMETIGARYDAAEQAWSITSAQRQLLKEEMEETVYSEKIETGLRDLPREARAKWLEGKVSEIPAVRDAIARIRAQWAPEGGANQVRAFQANAKRPEQRLAMSDIDALADLASIDNETWDAIRDKLSDAIQSMSFRKHFFSSDNVPGYSTDFERGITEYMAGMAGYLARREFQQRIDDALNGIEAKKLFEYASRYVGYTDGPQEEMALLRQLGFFTYIAGNISSGLVNLTQQAVMTFPALSQFANPARVAAELARANVEAAAMMTASRDIGLNLFDPAKAPADVRDDLMDAWESGEFIPTATFEIMATANQRNVGSRPIRRRFERAVQAIGLTFSVPERINRLATYIAAHRIAKDPRALERVREVYRSNGLAGELIGGEKLTPAAFAEFMVDETQFRMGKANRPTIMRGLGAPALQFKGFMMQSLEAWLRMVASQGVAGRAAAATSIAMVLSLSGIWGFPGGDDLRRALERFLKWATDRDLDLRTALRRGIYETTGSQWIAAAADRGAPFASGLDLGRVGLGNVMPNSGSITDLAGIPYDMLWTRPSRAATELQHGNAFSALMAVSPKFVANLGEAVQMGRRGFADTRGRTVLSRDDITAWDQLQKAIGFTPTQVTNARDARFAISRMQASSDEARRQFVQRIGTTLAALQRATTEESRAGLEREYERIIREVARFNERVPPENRVNLSDTTVRAAVRRQTEGLAAQYGRERRQARGAAEDLRGIYGVSGGAR